jgi:undecaprenyl-phosphate galactose phosphotransferase
VSENIKKYKYYYALMDFLVLSVSFVFTVHTMWIINSATEKLITPVFPLVLFLFMLSIVFIFEFNRLYTAEVIRSRSKQIAAVIKSLMAGSFYIFMTTLLIMSLDLTDTGILVLLFSAVAFSLLYIIRIEILRNVIIRESLKEYNILLVGDGYTARKLSDEVLSRENQNVCIKGLLDDRYNKGAEIGPQGIKVLGKIDELTSLISTDTNIDEVIICSDTISLSEIFSVIDHCIDLNIPVKIASGKLKVISDHFKTDTYFGLPVVDLTPSRTSNLIKRIVDIILSVIGIILLIPVYLIITLLIKLTSSGPILYKHDRIGLNGRTFKFYKFRSMTVSDEDDPLRKEMMLKFMKENIQQDETAKIINHNRLTPIGAFLRKYSLDELPQLFNVLKGDMSLVGPRPCLPYEFENYEPWQRRRVAVIPGCTGLWQITGRSLVTFNDSVLMDLYYINKRSVVFDFALILKTIPVIIFSKGGK